MELYETERNKSSGSNAAGKVELSFYGAAEEVGRSCIMLRAGNAKILLDAGLGNVNEPGNGAEGAMRMPQISDEELRGVNGIFVTHAHLDHCCFVAHAYARGYIGKVFLTAPTAELMKLQIADYIRISKPKEVTPKVLKELASSYAVVEYRKPFEFMGLRIEFINAGHILGSSIIKITFRGKSILYTGDLNLQKSLVLSGADLNGMKADTLIMESTYGGEGDVFASQEERGEQMVKSINETLLKGGKVIIPSFGVGRAQEVLMFLNKMIESGALQKVPVYADGSINKIMKVHRRNLRYCRKDIREAMQSEKNFRFVSGKERNSIVKGGSCIIVTTSGMLKGGPVIFYLQKLAPDSNNKMIMVGYQAEGTPGRAVLEGAKEVELGGKLVKINLAVEKHRIMAHADRRSLEEIPRLVKGLKKVFIVHGDKEKQLSLSSWLKSSYEVIIPRIGETYSAFAWHHLERSWKRPGKTSIFQTSSDAVGFARVKKFTEISN
ncbi:MAG: MBL fold metallo-hydrolase [Candidatus Micrarchaeaceae archaeon]